MPRCAVDQLTVTQLNKRVTEIEEGKRQPGMIRVGCVGGLALNARMRRYPSGVRLSASWVLRRTVNGKRRDFALGAWPEVTLAQARERARDVMDKLWQGIDPTEERRAAVRAQAPDAPTFREAARAHFDRAIRGRINARDEGKWFSDLDAMAFGKIGDLPVDQIEAHHMLAIAEQPYTKYGAKVEAKLWDAVPERARRLFKKVEAILAAETRLGHRAGANPAAWKDNLSALLPKPAKKVTGGQPALPYAQLPAFMAALRDREPSPSSRALEFLILTAARSGDVRGATWDEIDLERRLWIIPAERMKASREHRVPLSAAALGVLKATPKLAGTSLIWPGQGLKKPMSDMTLASLVKKMHGVEVAAGRTGWADPRLGKPAVPHGFRSTFRDWAAEVTTYPNEMAEIALAHDVGTAVERAYRRGDQLEKRRAMMTDWGDHALSALGGGLRAVSA
ncbi:MAG: integrase arm-type DNA-binding domain-containing protein [Loktanella sp.]|nr:integrase arm-type DNA-binding domain-containing protein [Loktanella sp.]